MGSTCGEVLRLTIFGQSHSPAVGMTLEGIPAGERIDRERLQSFLLRRAPGRSALASPRREADEVEILSGVADGVTCGAPLTAIIRNTDARPQDYREKDVPRPGHADYTGWVKYGSACDLSGGGHFSGRLTAPLCVAGGICLQLLERYGVAISARVVEIGGERDGAAMEAAILRAKSENDSVGGIVACEAQGVPAGLGDPIFDGMENRIARLVFGIPAVKGIEFGEGFHAARLRGSENNDPFVVENGRVSMASNHCGGILGGITTGLPIVFRVAFKPTPSIAREQNGVCLRTMEPAVLKTGGRHDPCVVPRAVPAVEAAAAVAIYDALLAQRRENR